MDELNVSNIRGSLKVSYGKRWFPHPLSFFGLEGKTKGCPTLLGLIKPISEGDMAAAMTK